jgi:periplasmic divalent cation tolerance protein
MPKIASVYRWKGNIERTGEVLLIVKTVRGKFPQLEREVRALHSYEIPEITAVPIVAGSKAYLDWITANVHLAKAQAAT